jgi:dienelactone hydrolase
MPLDYIVTGGRMLVQPIYQGSYERWREPWRRSDVRPWIERRSDLGRTIDYLESRADVDASRLAYVGVSFGTSSALPLLALEARFKAAVLLSGGLLNAVPAIDPVNYAPRITVPVLMVNGRYDYGFPPKQVRSLCSRCWARRRITSGT